MDPFKALLEALGGENGPLKEVFEALDAAKKEQTKEVNEAYKFYGFNPEKPPNDRELATWAIDLFKKYNMPCPEKMNLPLVGLMIGYNHVIGLKLNDFDLIQLKVLLALVYNMGNRMGKLHIANPFDNGSNN